MSTLIKKGLTRDIGQEAKKNSLSERWGEVEFIAGRIFGDYILGVLGVIANTVILAAIFSASTGWILASWIFSAIICVSAEWSMGKGAFQLARAYKENKHEEDGHGRAMLMMGVYVLLFLSASLYLSGRSGSVVEVAGERKVQASTEDYTGAESYYVERIEKVREAEAAKIADAKARVSELNNHRNNKGVVYYNSRMSAQQIMGKEIPAIQADAAAQIAALEAERRQMVGRVLAVNDATKATITERVALSSTMLMWINIFINLIRVLLLSAYSIFLSDAIEEERKGKRSSAPSPLATAFSQAPRPAMMTAEYKPATTPPPAGTVTPQPVQVRPFQNRAEPNTMEWDLSRTVELSPNITGTTGTAGTGTAGTRPEPVRENAPNRVPVGNDTRNTNTPRNTQGTAERITYVNKDGVRKEYTRSEVQSLCRKYAKRVKEHQIKGNSAAVENNLQMLETFKSLLA